MMTRPLESTVTPNAALIFADVAAAVSPLLPEMPVPAIVYTLPAVIATPHCVAVTFESTRTRKRAVVDPNDVAARIDRDGLGCLDTCRDAVGAVGAVRRRSGADDRRDLVRAAGSTAVPAADAVIAGIGDDHVVRTVDREPGRSDEARTRALDAVRDVRPRGVAHDVEQVAVRRDLAARLWFVSAM